MDSFIWAQIIGLFVLSLEVFRFQCRSSKVFFYIEPILSTCYAAQLYLLGADAYLINVITITRAFAGVFLSQKHLVNVIVWFYIPVYVFVGLSVASSLVECLPVLAILCSSFAFLQRENLWMVRRLYIMNGLSWTAFALPTEAYTLALCSLFIASSAAVAIFRYEEKYQDLLAQVLSFRLKKLPV